MRAHVRISRLKIWSRPSASITPAMSASALTGYASSNSFPRPGNCESMRFRKSARVLGKVAGLPSVVHSFALDPTSTGTLFCFFCANVEWTSSGSTQPSTLMDVRKEGTVTSFSAGTARSAFSESTPRAFASARPPCSTSASRVVRANCPPLSPIALWNKPFASGVACVVLTLQEPADSPKIVTFAGLPPQDAMFR